MKPYCFGDRT